MNTDNGMSLSTGSSMKAEGVSDQFPAGLRVLAVDDDPTCLKILGKMLQNCLYEVTTCSKAVEALSMLRERKGAFDIVLSDVYMPDMDGFKLLEHIGLEMDLPVIMMSADDGKNVVMKGITHGACDYLIKPVRMEAIKNIWQHVIRKKRNEWKELEHSGSVEDGDRHKKPLDDGDYACSANEGSWKHSKRRKDVTDEEDEGEDRDDTSALKKPRVVWSVELHQQFVAAVNQLGIDKAVPKKILELMNVPGLTRENVASHLQKYRLYLRRLSGVTQHQGGLNTSFMGGSEASFGSIASLDRFDFQALAVSGQLPQQNLATLQAGLGRINTNTGMGMSIIDPMNLFSSEVQGANSSSKIRYGPGQQPLVNNQVGLLQGLPTTLEPKQLPQLHHPIQSIGNMGGDSASTFLKLPPQLRTTISSSSGDSIHSHRRGISDESNSLIMQMTRQNQLPLSQQQNNVQVDMPPHHQRPQMLSSGMGQQMLSKDVSERAVGRNGFVTYGRGTLALGNCTNNPPFGVVSQTSVDYSINHVQELSGNAFPMVTTAGVSSLASTGMIREAMPVTAGLEGLEDWNLQNVNLSFEAAQHVNTVQRNPNFSQSLLGNQCLGATQKSGQIKGMSFIGKGMVSLREVDEHGSPNHIVQQRNNLLVNDSFRVKTESLPDIGCESVILTDSYDQEDLMNALFKQQEGVGPVENEFNIDGFPMDNIHV